MHNGKFGCAVWGCGWVASGHIAAWLKDQDCELIGIGGGRESSVQSKVREFQLTGIRIYQKYEEILNDPDVDIISICTPNDMHAEEAILAAKAGKQLFLEKPAAIHEDQLDRLLAAVQEYHTKSVMGLVLRFNPMTALQKRLIEQGELGRVFMANVDYWFGRDRGSWMKEGKRTGGAFVLGGCHSVDLASYLLGSRIRSVRGDSVRVGDRYDYAPVETAQVRFENGALGVFTCSLEGFNPYTANVHILGEDGTILNDSFYLKRFQEQKEFFRIDTGVKKTGDVYGHPFPAIVRHFVSCLKEGRDSDHNIASAANSHRACFAICRSASGNGEWINLL